MHELQGCELCGHHAAIRLDFRWRDRKWVHRGWEFLYGHQKSPSTGESDVRHWKSDCQLASTRESCQTLTSILLLLSSALSKSTSKHEPTRDEASKHPSSLEEPLDSARPRHSNESNLGSPDRSTVDTLFIPEDPNRHGEILAYVRKLLERVEESSDQGQPEVETGRTRVPGETGPRVDENSNRGEVSTRRNAEDQLPDPSRSSSLPRKYSLGNLTESLAKNTLENDGGAGKNNGWSREDGGEIEAENEGAIDPQEDDLLEAAEFGLQAMNDLYFVKEPKLYSMGLYLEADNPAKYVAAFNDQTDEARTLAKYGFAVLQGATMFRKKFPDAPTNMLLSRRNLRNPLERHCPTRGVPDCPPASLRYRTSDGSCNNLKHPWWGSAMSTMQRFLPAEYQDGIQSVRISKTGRPLPSARQITNVLHESKDVPLASVTHMSMQWGQFVDHDITATGQSRGFNGTIPQCCLNFGAGFQPAEFMHPECLPIAVSPQDGFFGPLGVRCLEFLRSGPAPKENCEFGPREQLSQVTSYLDASTVYSSNALQADSLRLFRNGLLQYGKLQAQRPLLPKQDSDLCKRGSLSTSCFRAGDGRLSEQPALTSLHVVFLRFNNRIATKLASLNPHWSDEKLFQETRRIIGAVVQHITYREFLPIVLGQSVLKIFDLELLKKGYYEGYDPTANPTIANAFSTAAYRFGHSLVQRSFIRFDMFHRPIFNNVSIHEEFSNPVNLETAGSVDRLLLGLINQPSQKRDQFITAELTNHLFQTSNFPFGMDLASLNIQRGRDHGIPPYVKWRKPCGLSPIKSFEDLDKVMVPSVAQKFRLIYPSVQDIDLFSAGLAENSVVGGLVGPTFACIIGQQFRHLRKGDRFWYENSGQSSFTPGQLQQIRHVNLAQVLCNTVDDIETIQPFVFLMPDDLRNQRLPCTDPAVGQLDLRLWADRRRKMRSIGGILDKLKKKTGQVRETTPKPNTEGQTSSKISQIVSDGILDKLLPPKTSLFQKNRVVVQKPFGPPDNFTLVVQNNAVNSPVFVHDAIYGSQVRVDPPYQTTTRPSFDFVIHQPVHQGIPDFPSYVPPAKPIPTAPPVFPGLSPGRPYVPYAFEDPSNPNPLNHGFQAGYVASDVVYETYPATSPRPTLYTYYTSFNRPITQRPQQESDIYDSMYLQDKPLTSSRPGPPSTYETGGQLSSKPHHNIPGNQYPQDTTGSWQKDQLWTPQGHRNGPNRHQTDHQSSWNERYRPGDDSDMEIKSFDSEYTTWSSVSSHQTGPTDGNRPAYQVQPGRRPVQADSDGWSTIPGSQKVSDGPDFAYQAQLTYRPSANEDSKRIPGGPSKLPFNSANRNDEPKTVDIDRPDSQVNRYPTVWIKPSDDPIDNADSYRPATRPHSIAEPVNQPGYKAGGTEPGVTSELPRPLTSQTSFGPIIRKPGQYYYEKNVLHRYPDKIEDFPAKWKQYSIKDNAEQRHKTLNDEDSTEKQVANDVDESILDVTPGGEKIDGVEINTASVEEVENVTSRMTWLNPEEDTTLPSASEVPRIPLDKSSADKELPKPIK